MDFMQHVFEAEKERVLLGEWLVLTTLGFDFNVHHPYKPLGATLRKLGMAKHPLAQVAWNFVNDGYAHDPDQWLSKSLFESAGHICPSQFWV
jgi:hypothetical protein